MTIFGSDVALDVKTGRYKFQFFRNFFPDPLLPKKVRDWSLRTLKEKLIKIGAKVVRHSRYVIFQMAEVVVPKALFFEILYRIRQLLIMPSGAG